MAEHFDLVAINKQGGVYALCSIGFDKRMERRFIAEHQRRRGNRVEVMPLAQATERHRAHLATLPHLAGLIAAHTSQREG